MRPTLRFLTDELINKIVDEARSLLASLGVEIHNDSVLSMLADHGARVDMEGHHAWLTDDIIDRALKTAPASFKLYDTLGNEAVNLAGYESNFTPGSTAINILDQDGKLSRRPVADDYVRYAKLMTGMHHIASQSTAMMPTDVHEKISDSYRLYLSLMFCEKPVITGTFTIEAFEIMKDLQLAVRGTAGELAAKPLTVFSACPTSPLKWSDVTSQNLVDCANWSIPVEYISMPLSGFMAPVTLVGSLIQHTAETLSGLAISQLTKPGAPVLYGGSPAVFDLRYETTPMGDVGTMMQDCAYNEIGKYLNLPTQAYIGLSDAKLLDAQAGLETSMGATLAVLAGINNISGPGMLDFESCFSLEKLVVDNEICGMTFRMAKGIEPRDDFPSQPLFEELIAEQHLLIADHTLRHLKDEVFFPGPSIDRANRSRWKEEGGRTLFKRANSEVDRIIAEYTPARLSDDVTAELTRLMETEARRHGMDKLPEVN
ncbi:MAG: trimethylamine methyltransferase family protein [Candidatus Zixiibacteriota bacterium]|nr:MAG: trimethylamine methyltransferase family protein [candidate division Zixibacteria bacterium]